MMREKDENVAAGLGQAQKCSLEKTVDEIPTLHVISRSTVAKKMQ
jgi:hypothetical protein